MCVCVCIYICVCVDKKPNRNRGTGPFFDITIAYYTHFHYIGVRNAVEMKGVQQFTIELNGPHGPPH